jgi:hypothetical protein
MSARKGQTRLKKIASQISQDKQLSPEDKEFLVKALIEISNGGDAETALAVKFKKGERKSKYAKDTKLILQLAYGWLASAVAPEDEDGLGMTLKDAVAMLKAEWGRLPSEQTMLRYWNNVKNTQERDFKIKTD